jgi:CPA2 family monovalent cation:H+ antiporter-2
MAVDVLHATGMRKYAARRLGQRFMTIDKASIRKLAKSDHDDEIHLFTTKEILLREEELLAYDNLNFDNQQWEDSSNDEEDEDEN